MRKVLATAVVLGLLAAGIGTAGAAVRSDDSAVTKDEIKIGVTYVDLAPIRARGINISHGNYEKAYQAVVDDINAKGGINGRKLKAVIVGVDPSGTTGNQAACVKLTEDEKVFAAVGFFLNDGPLCYLEQHSTPVVGGNITSEYLARAKAPWYTLEAGDAATGQIVEALVQDGALKKGELGIVTNVTQEALLDDVVMPVLKRNKISGTSAIIDAPAGDTVAAQAQADTIVQRLKADGVKTILAVGDSVVGVGRALSKMPDYRPKLVSTSQNTMAAYINDKSNDLSAVQNAVTGNISYDFNDPALQKCYEVVVKATGESPIIENPPSGQPNYVTSANAACRYIALFAELAKASGKNLTTATFGKAAQKAGTVEVPGSGAMAYDPKTHAFALPVYLFRFNPTTSLLERDPEPITLKAQGNGTKSS